MNRRVSSFQSKRLRGKKRKHRFYRYCGGVIIFLAIAVGASFLTRAESVRVENIVVEGTGIAKKEKIEEIVKGELNASYFWIFSKNNAALYPRKAVENKIYEQSAAIKDVSVSFDGLKTISVKIREYGQDYLWCDSEARDRCFFMDSGGYIFSEAADFFENVLFTYYGLANGGQPVGETYMPETEFSELNKFIDSVKLLKLLPIGLIARAEGDFELVLDSGGSILFSNREPFLTTFENIETIIAEQTRLEKDFLKRLDYIDVRFTSKAFVKLK